MSNAFKGAEIMKEKDERRSVKNFFIKRSIQFKIIAQILFTVFISVLITIGILVLIYNLKSQGGSFYYMSNDVMQDLELKSILGVILPALFSAEIIAIFVAFVIGLISSRKVAVPIYKIEKWATRLKSGKLNTTLAFREENEMKDLTLQCNGFVDFYRNILIEIRDHTETLALRKNDPIVVQREIDRIRQVLNRVEL
jgi:methyl-accepting chemotaxis protein